MEPRPEDHDEDDRKHPILATFTSSRREQLSARADAGVLGPGGYALALGVVGGFAGLVFMGVIGLGTTGTSIRNPAGSAANGCSIAVTAGAGVVVGLLRRLTRLPEKPLA